MAISRNRLPSRHDLYLLFGACVLPVHIRAIFSVLQEFPSLILRMTLWELVAASAYSLTFALSESLLIMLAVTLLTILIPPRWLEGCFAVRGTLLLCASLPWLYLCLTRGIRSWRGLLLSSACALLLWMLPRLLRRLHTKAAPLKALLERLSVLAYLYVALDVLSLLVVIARNI